MPIGRGEERSGFNPPRGGAAIRVISWNINSLRARLPRVQDLIRRHGPDVLCLQETKVQDALFPQMAFLADGYHMSVHGQATYNGVATLSLERPDEVRKGFAGDPVPEQARTIWTRFGELWIGNLYVVNGKHLDHADYGIKLRWLEAVADHVGDLCADGEVLLVGDWNVAPDDRDVWDPIGWGDGVLCSPQERRRLRAIMTHGLEDLHRRFEEGPGPFTWWDYRSLAFPKDLGLRIDLALATPGVASRCTGVWVDREERKQGKWEEKPSDHAPLVVDLQDI